MLRDSAALQYIDLGSKLLLVVWIFLGIPSFFHRFFIVPPHNWREKITDNFISEEDLILKPGIKRSAYRRRFICASECPAFYNNFVDNKIRVLPADKKNGDAFMEKTTFRDPVDERRPRIYGFFHPYANNGGGGEKVLWNAVQSTLLQDEKNIVVIYTVSTDTPPKAILEKASSKFGVSLKPERVVFIYLRQYSLWIDAGSWKHFTLIGQLFGTFLLAMEAAYELAPDVWIDTMGLPGSYFAISKLVKLPIMAYVHYPILQQDMFNKLRFAKVGDLVKFRPNGANLRDLGKFVYWTVLYYVYRMLGRCVDITCANGTWTYERLQVVWGQRQQMDVLYPPCLVEQLTKQTATGEREDRLLYLAQFRPEKRHALVVEEYAKFLKEAREAKTPVKSIPKLVLVGSCRTVDDSGTLDGLRAYVQELQIEEYVEIVVDCSFEEVKEQLSRAKFGLNGMWNEHFGICVVEYVSSGVVPIVHASAGPLLDILKTDQVSSTWQNEAGLFFKSKTDPDFGGDVDGEELVYRTSGQTRLYPELATVLRRIYLEQNIDLAEKRKVGVELMGRFLDAAFAATWSKHVGECALLEAEARKQKDPVEAVY